MKLRQLILVTVCLCLVYGFCGQADRLVAEEDSESDFLSVLELAGLGTEAIANISEGSEFKNEDWRLLVQLLHRLRQYSEKQLNGWAKPWGDQSELEIGNLYEVVGKVVSVEVLTLPEELSQLQRQSRLYRCEVHSETLASELVVLTSRVPRRWADRDLSAGESIRFRGVLLKKVEDDGQQATLFLTNRLSWFPLQGVPTGQAMLARHGMDVALLDEVVHRQPFVKPSVSREGDAFYACLATIAQVDSEELAKLARQNVVAVAEKWRKRRDPLAEKYQALKEKVSTTGDEAQKKLLEKQAKATGQQLAQAEAVLERSQTGTSSVAPLFLQPEQEVGELVLLEGIVRRAVWIAETDRPELESYYELEIFPPDSQDFPVVCCTTRLPPGFPLGDEIREPVRISGIFFKSWQYRSRKLVETDGETKRQQRLYTPIVVTDRPIWLTDAKQSSQWGLWGGVAFLALLVAVWFTTARLARRDRGARAASRQFDIPKLESPTLSGEDLPEIKT